jgi:protoporphyrinogen IX oxidase
MKLYLYIKAIHLIAVISWMAGLLYLPRLFAYHTKAKVGSELDLTFQTMERRLLRIIMNPAMILTYVLGFSLYFLKDTPIAKYFHLKLLLVIAMSAFHGMLAKWRKDFFRGNNQHTNKFYRIVNEVPTVLMIIIVILAVTKPF